MRVKKSISFILLNTTLLMLSSCSLFCGLGGSACGDVINSTEAQEGAESYDPTQVGEPAEGFFVFDEEIGPELVSYTVLDGLAIFEGDIILGEVNENNQIEFAAISRAKSDVTAQSNTTLGKDCFSHKESAPAGCSNSKRLWDNNTVNYIIDNEVSVESELYRRITDAVAHMEENTPLRFVKLDRAQGDYIRFIDHRRGCSSPLGKQRGQTKIRLSAGCSVGTIIHEIGHALGFLHEHTRQDRDDWVLVNSSKIRDSKIRNFFPKRGMVPTFSQYDYASIMHYKSTAFGKRKRSITIRPLKDLPPGLDRIGQRKELSDGDKEMIEWMYPPIISVSSIEPDPSKFFGVDEKLTFRVEVELVAPQTFINPNRYEVQVEWISDNNAVISSVNISLSDSFAEISVNPGELPVGKHTGSISAKISNVERPIPASDDFIVNITSLKVTINQPTNGASFCQDDEITLEAAAFDNSDPEVANRDDAFEWRLSTPPQRIAQGRSIKIAADSIPVGNREIVLRVTNKDDIYVEKRVTINMLDSSNSVCQ